MDPYGTLRRPVSLSPYDSTWPEKFAGEQQRLLQRLGDMRAWIEHVGSTSVRGLAAKPTIDVCVGIPRFEDAPAYVARFQALGYTYVPDLVAVMPGHRFLWAGSALAHAFHLHLVLRNGSDWTELLLFRDYLRSHASEAAAYEAVKRRLASAVGMDIGAYVRGKAAIHEEILVRARSAAR